MNTPITPIRIPLDIKKRIKRAALSRRKSLSQYIIQTMEKELKNLKP